MDYDFIMCYSERLWGRYQKAKAGASYKWRHRTIDREYRSGVKVILENWTARSKTEFYLKIWGIQ